MTKHAQLIFIRGLPGSGKSYLTDALERALGDRVIILDPDSVDHESQAYRDHVKAQIAEGVDPALHLYRFSRARAYAGIEDGKIIIWNQPFTNLEIFHKMVGRLRDHAEEHDVQLSLLIVEVETDPEIAKGRVDDRKKAGGHGPSDERFENFVRDYKSFENEGYEAVTVHGVDDVNQSVATIKTALERQVTDAV